MRDWNKLYFVVGIILFHPHFQPTYEGLKLFSIFIFNKENILFSAYLWGIETQLTLGNPVQILNIFSLPMRDWNKRQKGVRKKEIKENFQPTYEGLKRYNLWWRKIVEQIFSLPMRDWNMFWKKSEREAETDYFQPTYEGLKLKKNRLNFWRIWFSAYLWGIETFQKILYWDKQEAIFSLPMRDWNWL